jgi:hypothetical protein
LLRAPLYSSKRAYTEGHPSELAKDEEFQSLHGRSSPNKEKTHNHCI